jgi:hypothetical protein
MGFRRDSKFPAQVAERARHTLVDWRNFEIVHKEKSEYYKRN